MEKSQHLESELARERLGKLLEMKTSLPLRLLPAQVVGVDPSGWFKTIIINRGTHDGVSKGMPVIAPEGIVGQIVAASYRYSKVLLIIDPSSAIDAFVQRTRSRGIVEGETEEYCRFKYVLKKADISIGDTVISSGLDRVFPKGLRVGCVEEISKSQSGIFQKTRVRPFVDFARLEEVLVILKG
ncbi:MAG: rod shape-determining protein MreC [Desulfobacterales bacterium]|nr:rod shape-determining protein MreC [Desulfobacterales bacterium]